MVTASKEVQDECRERLLQLLKPGDYIYTVLRHVSSSGMFRAIDLYVVAPYESQGGVKRHEPFCISWHAANVMGWTRSKRYDGAIEVNGAGMDMGYHLVHNLSYRMFDGNGYALNHRWI